MSIDHRLNGQTIASPRLEVPANLEPQCEEDASESDKPNPQDPEFEEARPPSSPAPLLPGVPGDVTPAVVARAPTR